MDYKIANALKDMKDWYGLKEIKNVRLNMEEDEPKITFISNKPKQLDNINTHDRHTMPNEITYVLTLGIQAGSLFLKNKEKK